MAEQAESSTGVQENMGNKSKSCCVAYGCSNTKSKCPHLSFFRFPADLETRSKWIHAVRRKNWQPAKTSVLCSEHFAAAAYQRPPGIRGRPILFKNAVPSIFPAHPEHIQPIIKKCRRTLTYRTSDCPSTSFGLPTASEVLAPEPPSVSPPSIASISTPTHTLQMPIEPMYSYSSISSSNKKRGRPKLSDADRLRKTLIKNNSLRQRVWKLKKKSRVLMNALKLLQSEHKLHQTKLSALDAGILELVNNQARNKNRSSGARYSQRIRSFAFTVRYYSPRTYKYLQTVFKLPSSSTINRWLQSINCEPGFQVDAIKAIKDRMNDKTPTFPHVYSLVIDSMSIRQRLITSSNKIHGYVDYGAGLGDHNRKATEALVFLLVHLAANIRQPIAFFYVDKIDAETQANLIRQCLILTSEHGIEILNLTLDGCPSNMMTVNKLGAKIPDSPSFAHPTTKAEVNVTLDPAHMLKLCRNAFATQLKFESAEGVIDYKYIELLIKYQDEIGMKLATKIGKQHLKWENIKMKVKFAAQVLSSSVADALQYLIEVDKRFENAGPTITFIRVVDKLFDILNSHSAHGRGYKSAVTRGNIDDLQKHLDEAIEYLYTLRSKDGQLLHKSRRKTFLLGFKTAGISLMAISRKLFAKSENIRYVLAYKISQDHIETLFSKIRSKSGFNNNPDVAQFRSALRSLLVKSDITPSTRANCLELDADVTYNLHQPSKKTPEEPVVMSEYDIIDDIPDIPQQVTDVVLYIGGYITRSLKRCCKCSECKTTLATSGVAKHSSLIMMKNRGGLITPCDLVATLCDLAESTLRHEILTIGLNPTTPRVLLLKCTQQAAERNVQSKSECTFHSASIMKDILQRYLRIRLKYEAEKARTTDKSMRSRLNRLVVFSHV